MTSRKPNKPEPYDGKHNELAERTWMLLESLLNVDAAIFGAGMQQRFKRQSSTPAPMKIGDVEQKRKDRARNIYFQCHKFGYRP